MGDCWAVVIGINRYWRPEACLKGARNDALRVSKWLLQSGPGSPGVPARQVYVILDAPSPGVAPPALPPGVHVIEDATKGSINQVLERVYQRSRGFGERFYFFFAGHGVLALDNGSPQSAIVAGDFSKANTDNSLSLRSILDYFASTEFADQFFFIDACRNLPWEGKLRVGTAPWPNDRRATAPPVQQFVFFATSPGVKAGEITLAGSESGGVFSEALLNALDGKGAAKAYDADSQQHLVRWDLLVKYVLRDVVAKRIEFRKDPQRQTEAELIQVPQEQGFRCSIDAQGRPREINPILARFNPDHFPPETLEVQLEPDTVCSAAKVSVHEPGDPSPFKILNKISQLPVKLTLPPRHYTVVAEAAGYEPRQVRPMVPVYEPKAVTLSWPQQPSSLREVVATASGDVSRGAESRGGPDEEFGSSERRDRSEGVASERVAPGSMPTQATGASRSVGDSPPAEPPLPWDAPGTGSTPPARLIVEVSDSLALIDVVDTTGKVVRSQPFPRSRSCRPISTLGSGSTTSSGPTRGAGATARRQCKRFWTPCRWPRRSCWRREASTVTGTRTPRPPKAPTVRPSPSFYN